MQHRLGGARRKSKLRASNGRADAGTYDLSLEDVLDLYQEQRGLCYYSGVKMTFRPLSDWMASLERLDNTKGYVRGNVVWICCEFQTSESTHRADGPVKGSSQWS